MLSTRVNKRSGTFPGDAYRAKSPANVGFKLLALCARSDMASHWLSEINPYIIDHVAHGEISDRIIDLQHLLLIHFQIVFIFFIKSNIKTKYFLPS
jgi:hypothetical protein